MTATPTTLTAEMITDGFIPAEPQLSPDGRFVAYTVAPLGRRDKHRQSALWLVATDGGINMLASILPTWGYAN